MQAAPTGTAGVGCVTFQIFSRCYFLTPSYKIRHEFEVTITCFDSWLPFDFLKEITLLIR